MTSTWTPDTWIQREAAQQPSWPDQEKLDKVLSRIRKFPPLVFAGEARELTASLGEVAVISAGAGLHEELVFRVVLMGGMTTLLPVFIGRLPAWAFALAFSSLVFSGVHHLGPTGEEFTMVAFVYRSLAGIIFGLLYQWRGFAIAAWTHTLYDVIVLI